MASDVRDALDQLLSLAVQQGFSAADYVAQGPVGAAVQAQLDTVGLNAPSEVVDFLSWRNVIHPKGSAPLFWETEYWPFNTLLNAYRDNRSLAPDESELQGRLSWPGPPSWFPVLMTDPSEIVAVECGDSDYGSVWFAFTQAEPFRMYSSLLEAVAAAQRAIQSGAWWFDPSEGIMRAHRNWMPWPGDIDPWAKPRLR